MNRSTSLWGAMTACALGTVTSKNMTAVDNVCMEATATAGSTGATSSNCATSIDTPTAPDIVFLGVSLTYHQR